MRSQSAVGVAVTAITRTITVAAGVFAPGHLGELTWVISFELADAVLEETRTRERRLRALPSRAGIYFVLAMCLFPGAGYRGVRAKLTAGLDAWCPDAKALRDLRRRLGAAPLRALFELLAGPMAWPRMPGVRFGRYRTVAFGPQRHRGPRPGRRHRPRRAGRPERAAPATGLRPASQVPAVPLGQAPARQARRQPASRQDHHRDPPGPSVGDNTPPASPSATRPMCACSLATGRGADSRSPT